MIVIRQKIYKYLCYRVKSSNGNATDKQLFTIIHHFVSVICDTTCRTGETGESL